METIVRGYINLENGEQISYYFENTEENIASFIFQYLKSDNEIVINTIFGETLIQISGRDYSLKGREQYIQEVTRCLVSMKDGNMDQKESYFLDLNDMNDRDEFDSKDVEEKEFMNMCDINQKLKGYSGKERSR